MTKFTATITRAANPAIVLMEDMELGQIGVVWEGPYKDNIVMRSQSTEHPNIVFNLSEEDSKDSCWIWECGDGPCIKVRSLPAGTQITLTIK